MDLHVECYAGFKGEQSPRRFVLDGRTVEVAEVLDQWLGVDHAYFKVLGDDGGVYILRYDLPGERWEFVSGPGPC